MAASGAPKNPTHRVLVDFDPTLSAVWGRDVDDELAVLFLLATRHEVQSGATGASLPFQLVSLTATHANAPNWLTCPAAHRFHAALVRGGVVLPPLQCATSTRPAQTPTVAGHSQQLAAARALIAASQPGDTVLALGALTTVADALLLRPDLARVWSRVVVLGGSVPGGGGAELNLRSDPVAARQVFETPRLRLELISSEVAQEVAVTSAHVQQLHGCLAPDAWLRPWLPAIRRHLHLVRVLCPVLFSDPQGVGCWSGFFPWDIFGVSWLTDARLFVPPKCFAVDIHINGSLHATPSGLGELACDEQGGHAHILQRLHVNADKELEDLVVRRLCLSGDLVRATSQDWSLAQQHSYSVGAAGVLLALLVLLLFYVCCRKCRSTKAKVL